MVYLDPSPIAFSIGAFDIRWYGLFAAIIFAATYTIVPRLAQKRFGDNDRAFWENAVVIALVSGIIGSRILHVLIGWEHYSVNLLDAFKVWQGGLTTHGAIIGGILGLWVYARMKKRHLLDLTDTIAVPFAFGLALGRVGNIMNQEILGRPCTDCALTFEFGSDKEGLARHPVQLYAIGKNLINGIGVTALYLTTRTRGITTAAWILIYGSLRFIVEFYRVEDYVLGPFDLVQVLTAPVIVLSGVWLTKLLIEERRIEEGNPDAS